MSDTFIGEIDWFAFNFIPQFFLPCDGSLYRIQEFAALYSLIGTKYGGDGKTTFAVPNLAARVVAGIGTAPGGTIAWTMGKTGGTETVTLTSNQYPAHHHTLSVVAAAVNTGVAGGVFGGFSPALQPAVPSSGINVTNTAFLGAYAGGNGAHDNMQPYLVLIPAICADGVYPDFP